MIRRFGDHNYRELLGRMPKPEFGEPGFLQRRSVCGQASATRLGLAPIHDFPDVLVNVADFKAVIQSCIERQVFARYHQADSGVFSDGWSQSTFNLCWSYGLTASVMGCRAVENQPPVRLSPFSLGWLVGWKNRGFYCDEAIAGASKKGIAPESLVPQYNLKKASFGDGWETEALKYRPLGWWDTRRSDGDVAMIRQCLSILATGRPLYVAYNWWGHALEVCGMEWDESEPNGIVWILRNSHDEDDVIQLTGEKGIPDEAYGVRSTTFA